MAIQDNTEYEPAMPSDFEEYKKMYFSNLGKKGGKKTAEKGKDYFKEIGRKGALKRWKKKVV